MGQITAEADTLLRMPALQVAALLPDFAGVDLAELPVLSPAPGEVLVRIRACAIGFPDLLMTHGGYQTKPALPFIGGMDAAGEVAAVGAGVSHVAPGDRVIALAKGGGFAQYATYPAAQILPRPARLSMPSAAALGTAYLTAYVALVRNARIEPGEVLLVHGAAGGVGLAAVDLGLALGAKVIAVASTAAKRAELVRLHPAAQVIDPTDGFRDAVLTATDGRGADVIFDPVGGQTFTDSTRCIAFGGRLLIVGFAGGPAAALPTNIALIKGFSAIGVRAGQYGRAFPAKGAENLAAILELAAEGRINPHVSAALPLSDWREGFRLLAERQVVGRVVLIPGE